MRGKAVSQWASAHPRMYTDVWLNQCNFSVYYCTELVIITELVSCGFLVFHGGFLRDRGSIV